MESVAALADPEEVRLHLVAAARAGVALTYGELLERLGYHFSRPKMRALCAILGAVDEDAAERGEPELAVLVVRAERRHSRPGLVGRRRRHGSAAMKGLGKGPEARRFIAGGAGGNLRLVEVPFRDRAGDRPPLTISAHPFSAAASGIKRRSQGARRHAEPRLPMLLRCTALAGGARRSRPAARPVRTAIWPRSTTHWSATTPIRR